MTPREAVMRAAEICKNRRTPFNWASENADRYRAQDEAWEMVEKEIRAFAATLPDESDDDARDAARYRWIPCIERFPSTAGFYLTCWEDQQQCSATGYDGGWCWGDGDPMEDSSHITHWMPLPAAPDAAIDAAMQKERA